METIEETFAYHLAIPISRREKERDIIWYITEEGKALDQGNYVYYFCVSKIRSALSDIREHIIKTPIVEGITAVINSNVTFLYCKTEFHQIMDSIQARGVIYTLLQLSDEHKRKGVIAISTGHFAYTLCYFGKKFGIPVTVVMPSSTAHEMTKKCQNLSATVIVQGDNMIDVHKIALHNAKTTGLFYLDGNNHPNMIIGQATLGIEICEQMKIDVIILPTMVDGCGITAGIALALRQSNPNIKIIKGLFDLTIFVSKTDVQKENCDLLENIKEKDHAAIAMAGIRSGLLNDFITGKRVVIPFFGKTDLSMSFASNEPSLDSRAGPSTSSS